MYLYSIHEVCHPGLVAIIRDLIITIAIIRIATIINSYCNNSYYYYY